VDKTTWGAHSYYCMMYGMISSAVVSFFHYKYRLMFNVRIENVSHRDLSRNEARDLVLGSS
jgi:hypothetical protein